MIYLLKIKYVVAGDTPLEYEEFDSVSDMVAFMFDNAHLIASYSIRELHAIQCPNSKGPWLKVGDDLINLRDTGE